MSTLLSVAVAAEEAGNHLPIPAWSFGVLTLVVFIGLLFVVFAFRGSIGTMTYVDHDVHSQDGNVDSAPEHGQVQRHGDGTGAAHGHGAHQQGRSH